MCKDSRIVSMKSASGKITWFQVNMPLSLKADKVDAFADALQAMADEAEVKDGKLVKKVVSLIDDPVKVYAVSLGIVSVDRRNMCGRAVRNAQLVADAMASSDKKAAREDLQKAVNGMFSGNEWCDDFNWKVENRYINAMTVGKTDRHDRVNSRQTQTGNIERSGRVDIRAWCDEVRSLTQCKVQIVKTFV